MFISFNAFSQGNVWISHLPAPDTLQGGTHFTLVFTINVQQENLDSLKTKISIPDGWNLLSERKFVINEGVSVRYFYSISTPSNALASYYKARFEVFIDGRLRGFKVLDLRIKEVRKIEVLAIDAPDFIKEGQILESEFLIQNLGNRSERLTVSSSKGTLEGETQDINLLPNASTRIKVKQTIPITDQTSWIATSEISILTKGRAEPYRGFLSVPVFTDKPKKIDNYRRFPIEAGASLLNYSLGGSNQMSYQYFITGRGHIDANKKHLIDFNLRGPNQWFFPVLGSYDHYSLEYGYKDILKTTVGDYYLSFNNLMEYGRYGRGVYAEGKYNKINSRVFFQKARLFPFQKESFGGDLAFTWKEGHRLATSYFSKTTFNRNQWFRTDMVGLSTRIQKNSLSLESELAISKALGKYDYAFFNHFFYNRSRLNFSNNIIYSGKNFFGFYNNSQLVITNIGYYLSKKIGVGINHNYSLINPSLDVLIYNTSPFSNVLMFYGSYDINSQNRIFLNYTIGQRRDRQEPATFDYYENYGNLNYNLNAKKVRIFSQFRYGYTRNNLTNADGLGPKRTYVSSLAQPSFQMVKGIWLGAYFEHQYTSRFSIMDQASHYYFYGGTVNAAFKQKLIGHLMYRNNYAPDELYQARSFIDASLSLNLKQHRVTLSGGRVFYPNPELRVQNTLFFNVTYAMKINAPLARVKNVGRVQGKVTGLSPDVRRDGVLIRMGDKQYLTDHLGGFVFDNVIADKYVMTMHKATQHAGVIPTVKMPLEVFVAKDSTSYIEIPLSKTGGVNGKVNLVKPEDSKAEMPVLLLKLYNGKTSFLTDLKQNGEFSFKEVIPGIWNIKAFFSVENPGYIIEMDEQEIEIKADKSEVVSFTVKPRERRIFFSDQNFQISLKK